MTLKSIMTTRNTFSIFLLAMAILFASCSVNKQTKLGLKDALKEKYYVGAALNEAQLMETDVEAVKVVKKHFNSIVAENCMKSEVIQPEEGKFDFRQADKLVELGEKNNMYIVGHVLIWHSQAPAWFFVDEEGNDVSREVLIERMKTHITTVVTRYKGRVHCWDVVNEAINDDGNWRESKFYQIIGEEYISLAFKFAQEADPEAELLYNDYSMTRPERRATVLKMVENLKAEGLKISGVGMQAHIQLSAPTVDEFEESILAFSKAGLDVHITELDVTVLPFTQEMIGADISLDIEYQKSINPYINGLPYSASQAFTQRYLSLYKLFMKHSDKVKRVTVWGVNDAQTWRNYWPVKGRTDYPLLFDRNNQAKPVVDEIIKAAKKQ